jgi:hypothetical protein
MMAFAVLAAAAAQAQQPADTVFACQYFRNQEEAGDGNVHVVDMRVVRRSDSRWTLELANQRPVVATRFRANLGTAGGSIGLRWQDADGKGRVAYVRFSDVGNPFRLEYFWLGFDRTSVWPGYGCQSQDKSLTGAGA